MDEQARLSVRKDETLASARKKAQDLGNRIHRAATHPAVKHFLKNRPPFEALMDIFNPEGVESARLENMQKTFNKQVRDAETRRR